MNDPMNRNERSALETDGYYAVPATPAIPLLGDRSVFITRTYLTLLGAILAFIGLEVAIFQSGYDEAIAGALLGGRSSWLVVLGGFVLVSWLATKVTQTAESLPLQYLALAGFVVAEALIFVPLLYIAEHYAPGAIQSAALATLLGFAGLTLVAWGTRKDFSFLRGILLFAGVIAIVTILCSFIFGFTLGTFFSAAMVAVAGASILYDTSNIIHHYPSNRYVSAALSLFASVAMMFWYILRILSASRR